MERGIVLSAALLVASAAFVVKAEEKKMMSHGAYDVKGSSDAQGMGGMSPEAMAQMKQMSAPGPEHARLKGLDGRWNTSMKSWMKPGEKPMESKGTATFKWVLGGRFLNQTFNGTINGEKFEGMGYTGYDKMRKEYTDIWMDSMGTGIINATGQFDDASKTLRDEGTFSCPFTGETNRWYRSEWTMGDAATHTYTMYNKDDKGQEFKSMEIVYTRAK